MAKRKAKRSRRNPNYRKEAAKFFNALYTRTRDKGEEIPVEQERIEPNRGERI